MFKCEVCHRVVAAGIPQERLVVESRPRVYDVTPPLSPKEKRRARRRGYEPAQAPEHASGWEIVREVVVCAAWRECLADRPDLVQSLGVHAPGVEPSEDGEDPATARTPGAPGSPAAAWPNARDATGS